MGILDEKSKKTKKTKETAVPSVEDILTDDETPDAPPEDVTAAVGVADGAGMQIVEPPKISPEVTRAQRIEDFPLATIVCLKTIVPPPSYNKWRFPDGFEFKQPVVAKVPLPVARHLRDKGVAAIVKS